MVNKAQSKSLILAGNWKLHKNKSEITGFFGALGKQLTHAAFRKIIAVSPTHLEFAVQNSSSSGVEIFSQNCAFENSGAWTGEISPIQLKDLGVCGTLVGHSERRQHFGDTDGTIARRAVAALKAGLDVIYCVGETLQDRKNNQTRQVLTKQLQPVLEVVLATMPASTKPGNFVIAYEPVWAIGTGLTATTQQIAEAHLWVHELLGPAGASLPILYGGSVKPSNFKEIVGVSDFVNGGLVGGASLEPQDYLALGSCLSS